MDVSGTTKNIVLIDDDEHFHSHVQRLFLREEGYRVLSAYEPEKALDLLRAQRVDLVILDLLLKHSHGFDLLPNIKALKPDIPIVVCTNYGDPGIKADAIRLGAAFYDKPEGLVRLKAIVQTLLGREPMNFPIVVTPDRLWMEGKSIALKNLLEQVERTSCSDVTVLLEGEEGTFRREVAALIHRLSPRRSNPFVTVDCAMFGEDLNEGNLFENAGNYFREAGDGTLFLNGIQSMSPSLQTKIARVLGAKSFRPVGGKGGVKVKLRFLASISGDLETCSKEGKIVESLFRLLTPCRIKVPSLRERREDIPAIAQRRLEHANALHGTNVNGFSTKAESFMMAYLWPGNILELIGVVEDLALRVRSGEVMSEALPPQLLNPSEFLSKGRGCSSSATLKMMVEDFERRKISHALQVNGGRLMESSKMLGVAVTTLWYKMRKYGLIRPFQK
jgi:DNA-binding NtrC family response regulator